ncbi:MAG: hypothetical protein ACK5LC_18645, partial [Coprobacillaceae bacterium]
STDTNGDILNIGMEVSNKPNEISEAEAYEISDNLIIHPSNFNEDEVIKDNRSDKTNPSNIIRIKEDRIIILDYEEEELKIVSVVAKKEDTGLAYDVEFYVTDEPKGVQLYNISTYANKSLVSSAIQAQDLLNNNIIKQTNLIKKLPSLPETIPLVVTIKGNGFITLDGTTIAALDVEDDGTRTVTYDIPKTAFSTTGQKVGVKSLSGRFLSYDFIINTEIPQPEIVRFEFRAEDNAVDAAKSGSPAKNLTPVTLKSYINQQEVYYSQQSSTSSSYTLTSTKSIGRDADTTNYNYDNYVPQYFPMFMNSSVWNSGGAASTLLGTRNNNVTGYYSTITTPLNAATGQYYPEYNVDTNKRGYYVATVTFKGTALYGPTGYSLTEFGGAANGVQRINIPESERKKLNGLEEVSVKVTIIENESYSGNVNMLDGEELEDGETVTPSIITKTNVPTYTNFTNYFNTRNKYQPSFTVTTGTEYPSNSVQANNPKPAEPPASVSGEKRYIFSFEREPKYPNPTYLETAFNRQSEKMGNSNAHTRINTTLQASGLMRVWVDGYENGSWVGGSIREDISGDVVVTIPYDEYDQAVANGIDLNATVYGKRLVVEPFYQLSDTSASGSKGDNKSYFDLENTLKNIKI